MNNNQSFAASSCFSTAAVAIAALFVSGCADSEIKTYQVAREENQTPPIHAHGHGAERAQPPHVHADAPEGWHQVAPEGMRVASYQISGDGGRLASVAIIPLPGAGKIELQSVNMWREELGLPALRLDQLRDETQQVQVGDTEGILVDIKAESASPTGLGRIIGAVAERGNITWFVKMAGESAILGENREKFISFLKTIEFHEGSHDEPRTASVPRVPSAENPVSTNTEKVPPGSDEPNFTAPAHWTEKAPGPMIQQAFAISGDGGQAEVTISVFPGATGGVPANINRWRDQLGLASLPEAEATKSAEMLEINGRKDSYLVDIKGTNKRSGQPARMVAVGVPHKGQTWFFKLLGDESVVAKEKDAFVRFIVSAY